MQATRGNALCSARELRRTYAGALRDLVALNYCSSDNEIKITTKDKPRNEGSASQESTKCDTKKNPFAIDLSVGGWVRERWKDKQSRFVCRSNKRIVVGLLIIRTAITSALLLRYWIFYSWRSNRGRIPGQKAGFVKVIKIWLYGVRQFKAFDPSKAVVTRSSALWSIEIRNRSFLTRRLFCGQTNHDRDNENQYQLSENHPQRTFC